LLDGMVRRDTEKGQGRACDARSVSLDGDVEIG
jgi:hypothetical protein